MENIAWRKNFMLSRIHSNWVMPLTSFWWWRWWCGGGKGYFSEPNIITLLCCWVSESDWTIQFDELFRAETSQTTADKLSGKYYSNRYYICLSGLAHFSSFLTLPAWHFPSPLQPLTPHQGSHTSHSDFSFSRNGKFIQIFQNFPCLWRRLLLRQTTPTPTPYRHRQHFSRNS